MNRFVTAFRWEMKKLLCYQRGWFLLILILLLQTGIAFIAAPVQPESFDSSLYADYIELFGGVYSEDTARAVHAEADKVDAYIALNDPAALNAGAVTESQTEQYLLAAMKRNALSELEAKCTRLVTVQGVQPSLTYDLELTDYIRRYGYHYISLIGIAFLVPMLVLGDRKNGMEQILFPSATGKAILVRAKLLTAVTISTLLTAVCAALQWTITSLRWNFGALTVPIQSITGFEQCMLHGSVLQWIFFCEVLRMLSAPALALLLCFLCMLIHKEPAIIASGAILFWCGTLIAGKCPAASVGFLSQSCEGISAIQMYSAKEIIWMIVILILKTGLLGWINMKLSNSNSLKHRK